MVASVLKAIHYNHTHRLDMNEILLKRTFNSILLHPVFLRFFSAVFAYHVFTPKIDLVMYIKI